METCPKNLIIKSSWIPYEQDKEELENKLKTFISQLKSLHKLHISRLKKASNLTFTQKSHLNFLRNNKEFVILMSDKNLGPVIIERDQYIRLVLKEHLHDANTYDRLNEEEAHLLLNNMRSTTATQFCGYTILRLCRHARHS